MFAQLWDQLGASPWLQDAETLSILRQGGAVVLLLIVSPALFTLFRRTLSRWETRWGRAGWRDHVFAVLRHALVPLSVWALGRCVVGVFQQLGWACGVVEWVVPFFGIWAVYRILAALLDRTLKPKQAHVWRRQVLLPVLLLVAALHAVGLLHRFMLLKLSPRPNMQVTVGSILTGLAVLCAFYFLSRALRRFLEKVFFPDAGMEPGLAQILSALITYAVLIAGATMALGVMGIDLTTFTVVAGGLSVGLGFGLQAVVSNFVSGFILMFERSIGAGDVVKVGDTMGVVQRIGVRSTSVKTLNNIELIIPNSRFLNDTVTNFTRADPVVRVRIDVGVSYESDPRAVEAALLSATQDADVLPEPAPTVQFTGFGDSSLDFALLVWTREAARIAVLESELRFRIWGALAGRDQGQSYYLPLARQRRRVTARSSGGTERRAELWHVPCESSLPMPVTM